MAELNQVKADALYQIAEELSSILRSVPMSTELHETLWKVKKNYRKRARKLSKVRSCKHCGTLGNTYADHDRACTTRIHAELASTGWYGPNY